MIMVGSEEKRRQAESSKESMVPERSSSRQLHNFNLPTLRWGAQRHLRCMKTNGPTTNPPSEVVSPPPPPPPPASTTTMAHHRFSPFNSPPPPPSRYDDDADDDDDGIDAVREKVISDLRVAADRMKSSLLENKQNQNQIQSQQLKMDSARPCNLRTRRAACKEPLPPRAVAAVTPALESPGRASGGSSNKPPDSPVVTRLRGLTAAANTARQSLERGENSQKPKFSIELSREEIEHDFLLMTGKKPPRRPKRRTRSVQKKVDACFPGLWLSSDITPDSYKVPELPDSGKA